MLVARLRCSLLIVLLYSTLSLAAEPQGSLTAHVAPQRAPGVISVEVDATQAPHNILHSRLKIPVTAGPLTLLYPKWIPGEHMPSGPLVDSVGVKFAAGGRDLPWRRDDVEMYAYHLTIPQGVSQIEVAMDYVSPVEAEGGFSAGASATEKLTVISWNQLLLYPSGFTSDQLTYQASLKLPAGWKSGTALPISGGAGTSSINFQPATLTTLVDSPVIAGEYYKAIPLSPSGEARPAELDIAADSAAALGTTPETDAHYRSLVTEAGVLYGARHYRDYHFLLSLSDHVAHFGLEHHESNDSRSGERALIDDNLRKLMGSLLPHEYTHSWNGKYRRPAGLSTPNYEQPMKGELLWVYEGLTQYFGNVLTARCGLWSADDFREHVAIVAAELSHRPGRQWRPLQDTAVAAQVLYGSPYQWSSWRRGTDFYDEGALIWLDADTTIRRLTHDQKSIDDFARLFFGPPDQAPNVAPHVKPYTFDDVVSTFNQVVAYDWRKFFLDRLNYVGPNAPLNGIEGSGWRLVYNDTPNEFTRIAEMNDRGSDFLYSIGLMVTSKGRVSDSTFLMPAYQAGVMPGMTIVAVNGRKYSPEVLRDALRAAKNTKDPIQLLVENSEFYKTLSLDYHDGERYPHLVRDPSKADYLADIIKPHAEAGK
ncbi:MAG: M61 family metallopeptidase [Terriglobales bacterium]